MNKENLKQAQEVLAKAQADVNDLLKDNMFSNIRLRVDNNIRQMLNLMGHYSGEAAAASMPPQQEYPPITNFLGEEIERKSSVRAADLVPDKTEAEIFKQKVEGLYGSIIELDTDTVLNDYRDDQGVLVLRGVGKMAGIPNFKEAEVNVDYIESVKQAIEAKNSFDSSKGKGGGIKDAEVPAFDQETAAQRIERIAQASSIDEVNELIKGDERATVIKAAEKRLAEL